MIRPAPRTTRPLRSGRRRLGLAPVVCLALAAAGCSSAAPRGATASTASAGTTSTEPVTITWWTGQVDAAAEITKALVAEYHAAHPNVTVKAEQGASPDDMRSKLEVALGTDTFPDAAYVFGSDAAAIARSPKVVDLTDAVKAPSVGWDDFWGAERDAATVDGRIVGMPAVVGDLGVIYNKTLFKQAGLAEPSADWTWDDFRTAAKTLTDPANKVFGATINVSGTEGTVAPFWPMVWQQGGEILTADNATVGFDSPKTVASLELWRAMAIDDQSVFLDQSGESTENLVAGGKIAMMITGSWSLSTMHDAKLDYGVQVLPGFNGNHETTGGQDLWMLFDHGSAARTQATVDFISWVTQAEQDARWSIEQFNPPIRAASKSRPEFAKISAELPGYSNFVDNLANAKRARPPVVYYPEVSRILAEQIAAVLLGQADAKSAIATAVKDGNQAIADAKKG